MIHLHSLPFTVNTPCFTQSGITSQWKERQMDYLLILTLSLHATLNPWFRTAPQMTSQFAPSWTLGLLKNSCVYRGFPSGSEGKESAWNSGDTGSLSGSGRSPGEGNGSLLPYCGLENPLDRSGLQSMGSQRVRHDWVTNTHTHTHTHTRVSYVYNSTVYKCFHLS